LYRKKIFILDPIRVSDITQITAHVVKFRSQS